MGAAAEARESPEAGDSLHDEIGGVFGFADTKNCCYVGAACIHLRQADAALTAAHRAVELYASGPAAERSYGAESLARVAMAVAYLLNRSPDGAAESLAPMLPLPAGLRTPPLRAHLT